MTAPALESTVESLLAFSKGILAADESLPTIEKRFKALNISSLEENRGAYREMLFTTPGLSEFISGVILFDETVRQRMTHGVPIGIPVALATGTGTFALPKGTQLRRLCGTGGIGAAREREVAAPRKRGR